jgi:lipopolysaccharide assembly outer membrane protein LptD (OstA)
VVSGAALYLAAALSGLLVGASPAWAQLRGPVTILGGGQETTILADEIRQIGGANELLIGEGHVEITQGASRLLADRVELNRDTGEAVAQGRVVFFDGQDRLVGDRVDYNLKTGTGIVYNARPSRPLTIASKPRSWTGSGPVCTESSGRVHDLRGGRAGLVVQDGLGHGGPR